MLFMFTLKYIEKDLLAKFFDKDITISFISDTIMFVGMNTKVGDTPRCIETDINDGNSSFEYALLVTVTPERIHVSGALSPAMLDATENFIDCQLSDMRVRKYLQEEAHNAITCHIGTLDTAELFGLSESLRKVPEDLNGYYDTVGERAFFALVEQGKLKEEYAYRYLYDV